MAMFRSSTRIVFTWANFEVKMGSFFMHDDCNYDCAHSEFSADNKSHLEVNSKSGAQVGHKDPLGDPDCKYYYCDAFLWLTKIWHKDPLGNPVKECDFVICDWYVLLSIPVDERCLADSSVSGKNNLRIKRLKTFLLLFHLLLCLFKHIYSYHRFCVTSDKYLKVFHPHLISSIRGTSRLQIPPLPLLLDTHVKPGWWS